MKTVLLQQCHLQEALSLVWEVFSEFEAPDYSPYGIQSFKDFISYDSILELYENKQMKFWGTFKGQELVGLIATRGFHHISLLFVKKSYHRQGIAKNLFQTVRHILEQTPDIDSITVNASPYAVVVYKQLGFFALSSEQVIDGIRFTPMKYIIKESSNNSSTC